MKDYSNLPFQVQTLNNLAFPEVVGSFCIKKRQYLVIHVEQSFADTPRTDLARFPQNLFVSEVGQFKVNGQQCAVVEADQIPITPTDVLARLTDRELQVVKLIASGHPNKQVARQLHISEWTVSTHLRRIFAKLGVDSRAAMVYQCASLISSGK